MNPRVRNRFASAPVRVSHSSCRGLAIFALIAHGTAEVRGQCEPQWLPTGTGMNGRVNAFAVYNNELIAAGEFTMAGGQPANYIARWNGSAWAPLGTGMDWSVSALAIYNNELVAGGGFNTAGGQPANFIARWNGSVWAPLSSGMSGLEPYTSVMSLAVYNNELIAGGNFTTAGGVNIGVGIARWNGSAWAPLGAGMEWFVSALAIYNNELVAGGRFRAAGGQPANQVARWNGSSWATLGAGIGVDAFTAVYGLAVYNNELIAGGAFRSAGGQPADYIARWNGSGWAPLGSGMGPNCTEPWCMSVGALAVYNNELIAGGSFTTAGGQPAAHLARWGCAPCYPNCDSSTLAPILNINDYVCFNAAFAAGGSYANCDGSTAPPTLNVADFICFLNQFAAACP